MEKAKRADSQLLPEELEQSFDKPMMKLQYVGAEKSGSPVEVTEIEVEKVKFNQTLSSIG